MGRLHLIEPDCNGWQLIEPDYLPHQVGAPWGGGQQVGGRLADTLRVGGDGRRWWTPSAMSRRRWRDDSAAGCAA